AGAGVSGNDRRQRGSAQRLQALQVVQRAGDLRPTLHRTKRRAQAFGKGHDSQTVEAPEGNTGQRGGEAARRREFGRALWVAAPVRGGAAVEEGVEGQLGRALTQAHEETAQPS